MTCPLCRNAVSRTALRAAVFPSAPEPFLEKGDDAMEHEGPSRSSSCRKDADIVHVDSKIKVRVLTHVIPSACREGGTACACL
jgi:hypothetical protein